MLWGPSETENSGLKKVSERNSQLSHPLQAAKLSFTATDSKEEGWSATTVTLRDWWSLGCAVQDGGHHMGQQPLAAHLRD